MSATNHPVPRVGDTITTASDLPDPPDGLVLLGRTGTPWQRGPQVALWWYRGSGATTEDLVRDHGPLTVVYVPGDDEPTVADLWEGYEVGHTQRQRLHSALLTIWRGLASDREHVTYGDDPQVVVDEVFQRRDTPGDQQPVPMDDAAVERAARAFDPRPWRENHRPFVCFGETRDHETLIEAEREAVREKARAALDAARGDTAPTVTDVLRQHALGLIHHEAQGLCPDPVQGPAMRDPQCAVCRALDTAPTVTAEQVEAGLWAWIQSAMEGVTRENVSPRVLDRNRPRMIAAFRAAGIEVQP